MTTQHLEQISDYDLIAAVQRAATHERETTVELLALLGELDARQLYLGEGCASLFTYCTQVLHLSEHAAYHRIEGARVARRFPRALELLSSGALTLTTVALLRTTLTTANSDSVFDAAAFKSKREVELLLARRVPRPDVEPMLRRIPGVDAHALRVKPSPPFAPAAAGTEKEPASEDAAVARQSLTGPLTHPVRPRPLSSPLSADRFLLRLTVSVDTHAKLRRAQDLLRHSIPSGDPAAVLDRALTMLVDHLERMKAGHARRPRPLGSEVTAAARGRRIPRSVRRAVWKRDEGRCTFTGSHGRCTETAWLEFHHIVAFARGGPTDVTNLTLRCRAHNQFEGQRVFGPRRPRRPETAVSLPLDDAGPRKDRAPRSFATP